VRPQLPRERTGKRVAVVGSGPAGLAAAQQLARAGHSVVVFERAQKPGGLLRYGIPEFKMEKAVLDRRLAQLKGEGVTFQCSTSVGRPDGYSIGGADGADAGVANSRSAVEPGEERGETAACAPDVTVISAEQLRERFDAILLACGATLPRDLPIPGRSLRGVHYALEFLKPANMVIEGTLAAPPISAEGRSVVIIGGGDTGADCLGTVHRQGASSVHQLEILPEPPGSRSEEHPWPLWPIILRTSSAHEEGGHRLYSVTTTQFLDDGTGQVRAIEGHQVEVGSDGGRPTFTPVPGSEFELQCDMVLLAMGFLGAERNGVIAELGVTVNERGSVVADGDWSTNVPGVFVCGDMTRGQSLIVWAIAEGRSAAQSVDRWLMGESALPAPIRPGQLAMR
jgi:glutamate synthase (NADPH/NADH) small chain